MIAVTGSTGKTTTKEIIAAILQTRWNILKSKDNGNDAWFMTEYIKQINETHQAVVLEYAMTFAGEITKSCRVIQPNISIITNVGSAHIGNFSASVLELAAAKSELIAEMKNSGVLLLNGDDRNSDLLNIQPFKGKIIKVSILESSNYQAFDIIHNEQGINFKVILANKAEEFYIDLLGKHNVYNALFGIAIADYLGFTPSEIRRGLKCFKRVYRRLYLYSLPGNNKLIDDSFNADPESINAAIDVLSEMGVGKKIAILGVLVEQQGNHKGFTAIAKKLANSNIDYLYTVGCEGYEDNAKLIGEEAINYGFPSHKIQYCPTLNILFHEIGKKEATDTTFLVKGGMALKSVNYFRVLPLIHLLHNNNIA